MAVQEFLGRLGESIGRTCVDKEFYQKIFQQSERKWHDPIKLREEVQKFEQSQQQIYKIQEKKDKIKIIFESIKKIILKEWDKLFNFDDLVINMDVAKIHDHVRNINKIKSELVKIFSGKEIIIQNIDTEDFILHLNNRINTIKTIYKTIATAVETNNKEKFDKYMTILRDKRNDPDLVVEIINRSYDNYLHNNIDSPLLDAENKIAHTVGYLCAEAWFSQQETNRQNPKETVLQMGKMFYESYEDILEKHIDPLLEEFINEHNLNKDHSKLGSDFV